MSTCTETSLSTSGTIPKKLSCNNLNIIDDNAALNNKKLSWQQRLFGKQLINCKCNETNTFVDIKSFFDDNTGNTMCDVIGIYFSFINIGATCDDFTKQLAELYDNVNININKNNSNNENDMIKIKKFEVVHVVLWSNVTEVLDFDESFKNHINDLPWLAVPNQDYDRKVSL